MLENPARDSGYLEKYLKDIYSETKILHLTLKICRYEVFISEAILSINCNNAKLDSYFAHRVRWKTKTCVICALQECLLDF